MNRFFFRTNHVNLFILRTIPEEILRYLKKFVPLLCGSFKHSCDSMYRGAVCPCACCIYHTEQSLIQLTKTQTDISFPGGSHVSPVNLLLVVIQERSYAGRSCQMCAWGQGEKYSTNSCYTGQTAHCKQ